MKNLLIVFASVIALSLSAQTVSAQSNTKKEAPKTQQVQKANTGQNNGPYFVDKDNNGVCDNFENGNRGQGRKNGNGQGLRRGCRNGQGSGRGCRRGQGRNFVDANNDGVCDNMNNNPNCRNRRMRPRNGNNKIGTGN